MNVLIKNMKIPKNCDDCPMFDDHYDYPYCNITSTCQGYKWSPLDQRMSNCPLIELPSHGRLIDADVLYEDCALDNGYEVMATTTRINEYMQLKIDASPTIIESEE